MKVDPCPAQIEGHRCFRFLVDGKPHDGAHKTLRYLNGMPIEFAWNEFVLAGEPE